MITMPLAFWEGLALGLVASASGSAVLWWYLRNRVRGSGFREGTDMASISAATLGIPLVTPAPSAASGARVGPALQLAGANPSRTGTGELLRAFPARDEPASPPPNDGGRVRISHRVLVHIASQGRIGADEVPPRALTQAGMVEALEVNQGALTGVLRRLVAAGILVERREHVRGADRRLKVYRLTQSGEELYQEIRGRRPP